MIRHSEKSIPNDQTLKNNTNGNNTGEKVPEKASSNSKPESSTSNGQNNPTTSAYTLYLEHLGGFLPLLKGKRMSKIRPEFIIYDPQLQGKVLYSTQCFRIFCIVVVERSETTLMFLEIPPLLCP